MCSTSISICCSMCSTPSIAGRVPGMGWACPAGLGGEGAERGWEVGGTTCRQLAGLPEGERCGPGTLAERAPTGRTGRPSNSRGGRGRWAQGVPHFWGLPCAQSRTDPGQILDASWTHLGRRRDGEKPEGYRRLGVWRPPEKRRGVGCGVLRTAIVGGARVAVVFNPRLYWQNLSGATHTRNVSACRAKRGEKRYRRARPKVGRSG